MSDISRGRTNSPDIMVGTQLLVGLRTRVKELEINFNVVKFVEDIIDIGKEKR